MNHLKLNIYNSYCLQEIPKSSPSMRKSSSNSHSQPSGASSRYVQAMKNKTSSTFVNTDTETHQQTTKKNTMTKTNSMVKMVNSRKSSKSNLIRIETKDSHCEKRASAPVEQQLILKNQQLLQENKTLRNQYCKLQDSHLKDKAKIQSLISRMSQLKNQQQNKKPSKQKCKEEQCTNSECQQKRKNIEILLHKQRLKVFELEQQKKKWDKNREQLKSQYRNLLIQISALKQQH